jgi:hypothetical protein
LASNTYCRPSLYISHDCLTSLKADDASATSVNGSIC